MKQIMIVTGTRPDTIKLSPLLRNILRPSYLLVHTGQHYSYEMDRIFFDEMNLGEPDIKLNTPPIELQGKQVSYMIEHIEEHLLDKDISAVMVLGDTNSAFAGAFAAVKLDIPVIHVESGMRSYNRAMPEEINRILIDHISDYLFAPTSVQKKILYNEGIRENVYVSGDITWDAIKENITIAYDKSRILENIGLKRREYYLLTLHRKENADNKKRLESILSALRNIRSPVVFPIHPRTRKNIGRFGLQNLLQRENIKLIDPVGYLDMLMLEENSIKILTDSGGIQKEAYYLGVPCITLRGETEWTETLKDGRNVLVGADPQKLMAELQREPVYKKISPGLSPKKIIISRLSKLGFI